MSKINPEIDNERAADENVKIYSTAADSFEHMKRDVEKIAETTQRQKEESIASVSEAMGKIMATNFFRAQADFFTMVMLKKVKDSREYLRFGMTWQQFCDRSGIKRRTIDRDLQNLEPFRQDFLGQLANISGVTYNKVKYLGIEAKESLAILANNAITYNGETIPVDAEHKEDILALLETIEENHKKKLEEKEAAIRTKDRLIKAKDDVVNRMEKELMRLEKSVAKSDLTEKEQDGINRLSAVQNDFMGWMSDIEKSIDFHESPKIVLRSLYYLYTFIALVVHQKRMDLNEAYRDAEEVPWEIREEELSLFPDGVIEDNLPTFVGLGIGKKIRAKKAEREARKLKKIEEKAVVNG